MSRLPPLADDPRLDRGIGCFNQAEYDEAADLFEELFFESVRDEVSLARVLLQASVGMHHASLGHARAATQRLRDAVAAAATVTDDAGIDLSGLLTDLRKVIDSLVGSSREFSRPRIERKHR